MDFPSIVGLSCVVILLGAMKFVLSEMITQLKAAYKSKVQFDYIKRLSYNMTEIRCYSNLSSQIPVITKTCTLTMGLSQVCDMIHYSVSPRTTLHYNSIPTRLKWPIPMKTTGYCEM